MKKNWDEFLDLLLVCQDKKDLQTFFELFTTIEEREMLCARYGIVKNLLQGNISQREISSNLKVSIAQITRGSNALKTINHLFKKKMLQHLDD